MHSWNPRPCNSLLLEYFVHWNTNFAVHLAYSNFLPPQDSIAWFNILKTLWSMQLLAPLINSSRQYDPVIIVRTIGLMLGPSTALYEPFIKHCTLINKAVGTIWRALFQTSSEATGSWSLSPLIVSRDSFSHQTWARFQPGGAQPALFGCREIYFWYIIFF